MLIISDGLEPNKSDPNGKHRALVWKISRAGPIFPPGNRAKTGPLKRKISTRADRAGPIRKVITGLGAEKLPDRAFFRQNTRTGPAREHHCFF
jgi:hypothetical protein